jgi:hypothetical protein
MHPVAAAKAQLSNEDLTVDLAQAYIKARGSMTLQAINGCSKKVSLIGPPRQCFHYGADQQFRYQDAEKVGREDCGTASSDIETQKLYLQVLTFTGNSAVSGPLARKMLTQKPHDFDFLYVNGLLEQDAGKWKPRASICRKPWL